MKESSQLQAWYSLSTTKWCRNDLGLSSACDGVLCVYNMFHWHLPICAWPCFRDQRSYWCASCSSHTQICPVQILCPCICPGNTGRTLKQDSHHQPRPPVPPVGLEGPGLAFHFICPSLFSRRCHLRSLPFRRYTRLCARRISQETHTGVYDQWCAGNLSVYTTWDSLLKTPVTNGQ